MGCSISNLFSHSVSECSSYKNLSDPDRAQRAVTTVDGELCDRYTLSPGWYRFTGDAGDKMPTSCVPILRCMTAAPGWLNGVHPVNSSTVNREICFNWKRDCCIFKVNVRVKLCRGFYIYQLPYLPHCDFRYCGNALGKFVFNYSGFQGNARGMNWASLLFSFSDKQYSNMNSTSFFYILAVLLTIVITFFLFVFFNRSDEKPIP